MNLMLEIERWLAAMVWAIVIPIGWTIGHVLRVINRYAFPAHCREAVDLFVIANVRKLTLRSMAGAMWRAWTRREQLAAVKREAQQRRASQPERKKVEFQFREPEK